MSSPPYEKSVFINCPFDEDYEPLLHSIVLCLAAHGFHACCALSSFPGDGARIDRIWSTLSGCRYSIHDLSRYTGEGPGNLSRFNMPLELGLAMALGFERRSSPKPHDWHAMVGGEAYAYQRFISDLAGFDLGRHEGSVDSVIAETCSWLRETQDAQLPYPVPAAISAYYPEFRAELKKRKAFRLGRLAWADILDAAATGIRHIE